MDFDPDVKFGLLKLEDGNFITNNPRFNGIPQLKNSRKININENFDEYFEIWKNAINIFFEFMKTNVPGCKIILIKGRFKDTFTDGTSLTEVRKQQNIPLQNFVEMNKTWNILDEYIVSKFNVNVIDMSETDYSLNKNHIWGPYYLHYEDKFYNSILNKLIFHTYSEKEIKLESLDRAIQRLYLNDEQVILGTKIVEVVLDSDENIIKLSRKSKNAYNLYKDLLKKDYIFYYHNNGISKLYKRKNINDLWRRKDLYQEGDHFYTLNTPNDRKENKNINEKKLLVIFNCMPGSEHYDSYNISNRLFPNFFNGIERNLIKNVYTLRPMDLNCSHGSHYVNTINNNTMEKDIINMIYKVKSELEIEDKNIVLYGVSKGGTGSLYYGSKLDLKCLAVDPIISLEEYNKNDTHFLKDMRKVNLVSDINNNLYKKSNCEKHIIGSENVPFNYSKIKEIEGSNVIKYNKLDNHIQTHPDVSKNTVPEQLMILNILLGGLNHH